MRSGSARPEYAHLAVGIYIQARYYAPDIDRCVVAQ